MSGNTTLEMKAVRGRKKEPSSQVDGRLHDVDRQLLSLMRHSKRGVGEASSCIAVMSICPQ